MGSFFLIFGSYRARMQRRGHGCSAEGTRDGRTTSQPDVRTTARSRPSVSPKAEAKGGSGWIFIISDPHNHKLILKYVITFPQQKKRNKGNINKYCTWDIHFSKLFHFSESRIDRNNIFQENSIFSCMFEAF